MRLQIASKKINPNTLVVLIENDDMRVSAFLGNTGEFGSTDECARLKQIGMTHGQYVGMYGRPLPLAEAQEYFPYIRKMNDEEFSQYGKNTIDPALYTFKNQLAQ